MSNWTYNDGLSDDEFSSQGTPENPILINDPQAIRITRESAVSPDSVVLADNFITDASNDRPYTLDTGSKTYSHAVSPASRRYPDNIPQRYPIRDEKHYNRRCIPVNFTHNINSSTEMINSRYYQYINYLDVFEMISLGGRLPRKLQRELKTNIDTCLREACNGNVDMVKLGASITTTTSSKFTINNVACPELPNVYSTLDYDVILGECTAMFLKYPAEVIY
jgi:hypothetical protein